MALTFRRVQIAEVDHTRLHASQLVTEQRHVSAPKAFPLHFDAHFWCYVPHAFASGMSHDTTYFLAALIVRAKGSIQSGLAPVPAGDRNAASIIS